jgi:succinoglycan biosynthesis transport protein ExoP
MESGSRVVEIDLKDLLVAVIRRWWLVFLCVLLTCGLAYGISKYYLVPEYEATSSLFLGKEPGDAAFNLGLVETNNKLLGDYVEIVKSRLVSGIVIEEMGLDLSIEDFQSRVAVNIANGSRVFTIGFTSKDPKLAADITNTLAKVIINKANMIIGVQNIQVIDLAVVPSYPIGPGTIMIMMEAGILGLFLSLFIIFMVVYTDRTMKKVSDVEHQLGLSVLGIIPMYDTKWQNKGVRRP